jgi:hypothetical protein
MLDAALQNCYIALVVISFIINVLLLLTLVMSNEVPSVGLKPNVSYGGW